jgi:hypothetical protein
MCVMVLVDTTILLMRNSDEEQQADKERHIAQQQVGALSRKRKSAYILVDDALDRLFYAISILGRAYRTSPGCFKFQYMRAVAYQMYDVKH